VGEAIDRRRLERDLDAAVAGEVRFDAASRALYASDASNYRQVPIGVVVPRSVDDIVAVHETCRRHGAPLLARGCGTSLSGETVNVAVVIDCSKYLHEIRFIDTERRLAGCQPGVINDQLNTAAARHGLVFAPDPSTHAYCTIGGNVGNNSCGTHSVLGQFKGDGGRTSDNVIALDIITYEGVRMQVGATDEVRLAAEMAAGGPRAEIYAGAFQMGTGGIDSQINSPRPLMKECVTSAADLLLPQAEAWNVLGTGWRAYGGAIRERLPSPPRWTDGDRYPQACDVARLAAPLFAAGKGVAPEQALPVYLRDKVALTLEEQHASRTS